jgi:hypothetical protein
MTEKGPNFYVFYFDIFIVLIFWCQEPSSFGSLLELCWKGTKTVPLEAGGERKFLQVLPPLHPPPPKLEDKKDDKEPLKTVSRHEFFVGL